MSSIIGQGDFIPAILYKSYPEIRNTAYRIINNFQEDHTRLRRFFIFCKLSQSSANMNRIPPAFHLFYSFFSLCCRMLLPLLSLSLSLQQNGTCLQPLLVLLLCVWQVWLGQLKDESSSLRKSDNYLRASLTLPQLSQAGGGLTHFECKLLKLLLLSEP